MEQGENQKVDQDKPNNNKKTILIIAIIFGSIISIVLSVVAAIFVNEYITQLNNGGNKNYKPAIFVYSPIDQPVTIKLNFKISDEFMYPNFNNTNGWNFTATQNGKIKIGDNNYDYLFWEGNTLSGYNYEDGFVVNSEDLIPFFEEKLTIMGLNDREREDFITFWAPKMVGQEYNLIRFPNKEYSKFHPMEITPKPDSLLRVFMVYKPISGDYKIKKQQLSTFERSGLTVVEWGGKFQN